MTQPRFGSRLDALLLTAAATLGTLPVALLSSACLARFLPLSADTRYARFGLADPLWIGAMCVVFVARHSGRALLACVLVSVALAAAVYGVPH